MRTGKPETSTASARRATAWAGPLVALALAGCGGGSPRPAYMPPDPPPIPLPKPPAPAAALSKIAPPSPAVTAARLAPAQVGRPVPGRGPDRPMPFAYLVQPGDTVYGISRKLSVPLREVIDANVLSPPYTLSVSQTLRIPNPRRHTVRRGDTVYGISRAYGVEMTELVRLNGVEPPYTISPGVRLVLPAATEGKPLSQSPDKLASPAKTAPRAVQRAAVQSSAAKAAPAPTSKAVPAAKPARLAKIPQPQPRAGSKFLWPAKGKLLATYGPKKGGLHNDGINIAAPRGTPVRAAENGVVVYSGNELRGFGNLILIKHADGWVTAYAHTQDIRVGRGQQVKRGQTIAKVGSSGNVSRPQLHFEIRKGARAVDPRRLLDKRSA